MHVDDTRIGFANAAELRTHTSSSSEVEIQIWSSLIFAQAFGFLSLPFLSIAVFLIFWYLQNGVPLLGRKYISMFFFGHACFRIPIRRAP